MDVLVKMLLKVWKVSTVLELLTVLLQEAQGITVAVGTDFSHGLETKQDRPAEDREKTRHFTNRKETTSTRRTRDQSQVSVRSSLPRQNKALF